MGRIQAGMRKLRVRVAREFPSRDFAFTSPQSGA
jgi:hypothetical protein